VAIAFSIASEMFGNAVTTLALECAVCAGEAFTANFIRSVGTVTVVVTAVAAWNAFAIRGAAEFRSGTFAILMAAEFIIFIVTVGAIVFKITGPAARNASLVFALEFGGFVTFRTLFRQFIGACKNYKRGKNEIPEFQIPYD
jgi:hypothetical protein